MTTTTRTITPRLTWINDGWAGGSYQQHAILPDGRRIDRARRIDTTRGAEYRVDGRLYRTLRDAIAQA